MKWCAITDGKLEHLGFIRLFCSLQCYQSGLWSTIPSQPLNKYRFTLICNTVQYLERSNHLPVDIPSVKGKWSYRFCVSSSCENELDILYSYVKTIEDVWIRYTMCHNVADDGNTSSRHSKLSYIASGQPISLSCRQTVPEVSNLLPVDIPTVKGNFFDLHISNTVQYLERSNHLPVDISYVKGKWSYRFCVSSSCENELDILYSYVKTIEDVWIPYTMCHNGCHIVHKRHQKLAVADDGNTSSRHSKLSYIASGQPISLSCRQTVPEVSNLLPVDIPTVKGKWPYRYVSEFPLRYVKTIEDVWIRYTMFYNVADDGNTSSRHSMLSYIASGQPINFVHNSYGLRHLMVSVLVPSGVSSPENKGIHKLLVCVSLVWLITMLLGIMALW
ncbi:hypothetical protein T06_14293 [Trichinella sp. T6]|nr:hypothetical protein T06_14293 [Trichinella sp. T6]